MTPQSVFRNKTPGCLPALNLSTIACYNCKSLEPASSEPSPLARLCRTFPPVSFPASCILSPALLGSRSSCLSPCQDTVSLHYTVSSGSRICKELTERDRLGMGCLALRPFTLRSMSLDHGGLNHAVTHYFVEYIFECLLYASGMSIILALYK